MKATANSKMRLIFLHVRSIMTSSHAIRFVFAFSEQTFGPGRYIEECVHSAQIFWISMSYAFTPVRFICYRYAEHHAVRKQR